MRKSTRSVLVSLAMFVAACGLKPDWIRQGGSAFDDNGMQALYGVGLTLKGPNPYADRVKSESAARRDLANQIETYVATTVRQVIEEHRDFMRDDSTAGSTEVFQIVGKEVAEATLQGAQIIDHWEDDESLYALARLPLDGPIAKQIAEKSAAALRERLKDQLTERADALQQVLDEELAKKTARQQSGAAATN